MALKPDILDAVLALESSDDEGEDDCVASDMTTGCMAVCGRIQPPQLSQADTAAEQYLAASCLLLMDREECHWIRGYAENLVRKSEHDFFQHVRITGETFFFLLDMFQETNPWHYRGGRRTTPRDVVLCVGLGYLGTHCTYRQLAKQYGISEGCAHFSVQSVINFLNTIADKFIEWPIGKIAEKVETDFKCTAGFPGVIGALDGFHFEVKVPVKELADYINRSRKHIINFMAVCNSNKAFTYINVGFVGSAHDSRILRSTDFYDLLIAQPSPLFPSEKHHILGDSAFPLSQHLLVPFIDFGDLSEEQRLFNTKLSATRGVIENAFGFLRTRFRRLRSLDVDIDRASKIIKACCVLHNISLMFPRNNDFLLKEGPILYPESEFQASPPENELAPCVASVNKRKMFVDMLQKSNL